MSASRILVAHYDAAQAESMQLALEGAGAEVFVAHHGEEALQTARKESVEIAFVSTLLPGTHGFEVCRQLSATPPSGEDESAPVAVILLSDIEDPYVRARGRHVGAKQVVLEPLAPEALRALLEVRWENVDPLDVPIAAASEHAPSGGLLDELLGGTNKSKSKSDPSEPFLEQLADPSTGLANEAYTMMKIDEEAKRAARYHHDLSLIVAQIDNFAELRRRGGAAAGAEAALDVAGIFLCESRDVDVAGRVGEARFALVMPDTPAEGAAVAASRFRSSLAGREVDCDGDAVRMEVSLGVATIGADEAASRDRILARAEEDRRRGTKPSRS